MKTYTSIHSLSPSMIAGRATLSDGEFKKPHKNELTHYLRPPPVNNVVGELPLVA